MTRNTGNACFFRLVCHYFSSRCMLELTFAIYHRASLSSQASSIDVDVCSTG